MFYCNPYNMYIFTKKKKKNKKKNKKKKKKKFIYRVSR